jgi:hypothetical protein
VGYALLATVASAAEALTGGPRLVGGCRMRGPSVVLLVLDGVVGGEGAWLTPSAGLPRALQGLKARVARPVIVRRICRPWPVSALFIPGLAGFKNFSNRPPKIFFVRFARSSCKHERHKHDRRCSVFAASSV